MCPLIKYTVVLMDAFSDQNQATDRYWKGVSHILLSNQSLQNGGCNHPASTHHISFMNNYPTSVCYSVEISVLCSCISASHI